jgi:hypothetical protein
MDFLNVHSAVARNLCRVFLTALHWVCVVRVSVWGSEGADGDTYLLWARFHYGHAFEFSPPAPPPPFEFAGALFSTFRYKAKGTILKQCGITV